MRLRGTLIAAAAGLALAVAPASGEDAKPTPGCAGLAFTDPAGDAVFAVPLASTGPGAPNTDLIAGWFTSGEDGVYANLQVANLDETVTSPSTATGWYMVWTLADATKFVKAETTGSGFTYNFGTLDAGFQEEGDTSGKAFLGDKGVLRIKIPAASGGADGKKLGAPYGHVTNSYSVPGVGGALGTADDGPDSQAGKTFTVGGCAEDGAAPAPAATPSPAGGASAPAAKLDVKVSPGFASAKKVGKAKKLALTLKSSSSYTSVVVTLATAKGKTVASGKLAKLGGTAKLTLKLKSKPKAGSYKLKIAAKTSDGASVRKTFAFKLKK